MKEFVLNSIKLAFMGTLLISFVAFILGCTAATTATPTTPTSDAGNGVRTNPPAPPPPSISIASFSTNNVTVYGTNFIITADAPNELVVSGTCEASEDGHTVEVLAQAISTNNIVATNVAKTATCTEAGSSATWTTIFTRDNLNTLQTNNMRASFGASITNNAGLTGKTSSRALFVQPDIAPRGDLSGGNFAIRFSDIYQIGDACQLVLAVNVTPTGPFTFSLFDINNNNFTIVVRANRNLFLDITNSSLLNFYPTKSFQPASLSFVKEPFIITFFLTIPKGSNAMHRFRVSVDTVRVDSQTYQHCGVAPSS